MSRLGTTAARRSQPFRARDDGFLASASAPLRVIIRLFEEAAPGITAKVIARGDGPTLIRAGARLIDLQDHHREHEPPSTEDDPFTPFVRETIASVSPNHELTRVSLTAPPGRDDRATVMQAARDLAARVSADGGAEAGAWLARDRRDVSGDLGHHVYGLLAAQREARQIVLEAWGDLTGATPAAIRQCAVSGWPHYATTGDDRSLRRNLETVLRYGLHDLPRGEVRDLGVDVVVSGALAGPWDAFLARGGGEGRPAVSERLLPMGTSRSATECLTCGAALEKKRADAKFCSDRCRMARRDRRSKP